MGALAALVCAPAIVGYLLRRSVIEPAPQEGACNMVGFRNDGSLIVRQSISISRSGKATMPPSEAIYSIENREFVIKLLGVNLTDENGFTLDTRLMEQLEVFVRRLANGKPCRLVLDKRRQLRDGRFLAYVYCGDRFLNEELVRIGLARIEHYPGDSAKIAKQLRAAEQPSQ